MPTTGLLLGKFLPPHRGHQYLVDFARFYADDVTVHVCSTPAEPIAGSLRFRWVRDHFAGVPGVRVVHNDDPLPQTPEESPHDFYDLWRDSLLSRMERKPDFVFASEPYGYPLAESLGAHYIPVDHARERVPVSGTLLRSDPARYFEYLLPPARPYFARRVALVGPESSGKSTLTAHLAHTFGAVHAAEYARGFLEAAPHYWLTSTETGTENGFNTEALEIILRGQRASVEAMALQCTGGVVFSDTEAIVTACWAQVLLGHVPPIVEEFVQTQQFDLYLVTSATESWVDDTSRVQPAYAERYAFEQEVVTRLQAQGYPYLILRGTWNERTQQAETAVKNLLATPRNQGRDEPLLR